LACIYWDVSIVVPRSPKSRQLAGGW